MEKYNKKSIYCNILILLGLSLSGIGLFYWLGFGPALFFPGIFILSLGTYGAIR